MKSGLKTPRMRLSEGWSCGEDEVAVVVMMVALNEPPMYQSGGTTIPNPLFSIIISWISRVRKEKETPTTRDPFCRCQCESPPAYPTTTYILLDLPSKSKTLKIES
jgi:hypothetical protein